MLIAQAATAQTGGFPDRLPQENLQSELEGQGQNDVVLGWCNVARVSNIVSHMRLKWLGHLARMPHERFPKRALFGRINGSRVRGRCQKQRADCAQKKPAVCRAFIHMVEEIPRQARLEGCHRLSAATHLFCELEGM